MVYLLPLPPFPLRRYWNIAVTIDLLRVTVESYGHDSEAKQSSHARMHDGIVSGCKKLHD